MPRTVRNPKNVIIQILSKTERATWADLHEKTKLSKGALSKHLNLLIEWKRIKVDVDVSKKPRTVVYSLAQTSKEDIEKAKDVEKIEPIDMEILCNQLIAFSSQSGYQISKLKDREQARILLKDYLVFNVDTIAAYIPYFVDLAFAFSTGVAEEGKLEPKKQYEVFIKRLKENFVKKILAPWIESLAFSAFQNQDISLEISREGGYPSYASERGRRIDASFFDKMARFVDSS